MSYDYHIGVDYHKAYTHLARRRREAAWPCPAGNDGSLCPSGGHRHCRCRRPRFRFDRRSLGAAAMRVKAPGYSNGYDRSQNPIGSSSGDDAAKALDGTFTLTTNAEIVSQNEEDGAQNMSLGKRIVWKVTPMTSEASTGTLRLKP